MTRIAFALLGVLALACGTEEAGAPARAPSGLEAVRIGVWNSVKPAATIEARSFAITFERSTIFWCRLSRRRSRKRYLSRVSSGYSTSPKTGSGSSSAAPSTSMSRM